MTSALKAVESWPKEIQFTEGALTVYQPQADSYSNNILEGRSAVSWMDAEGGPPVFGALWLTMKVEIDRSERMVYVRELKIPQIKFPEAEEEEQKILAGYLERELPSWDLPLELDLLIADLNLLDETDTQGIRHDPPKILYSPEPAVLVSIEGEPKLEEVTSPQGDRFERVVNTPFLIVKPTGSRFFYLSGGGELWYLSESLIGPWAPATSIPPGIASAHPKSINY
jgi:hypothetical protein